MIFPALEHNSKTLTCSQLKDTPLRIFQKIKMPKQKHYCMHCAHWFQGTFKYLKMERKENASSEAGQWNMSAIGCVQGTLSFS